MLSKKGTAVGSRVFLSIIVAAKEPVVVKVRASLSIPKEMIKPYGAVVPISQAETVPTVANGSSVLLKWERSTVEFLGGVFPWFPCGTLHFGHAF